jgi:hypothetical protein
VVSLYANTISPGRTSSIRLYPLSVSTKVPGKKQPQGFTCVSAAPRSTFEVTCNVSSPAWPALASSSEEQKALQEKEAMVQRQQQQREEEKKTVEQKQKMEKEEEKSLRRQRQVQRQEERQEHRLRIH